MHNISRVKRLVKCRLLTVDTQDANLFYGYTKLLNQAHCIGSTRQLNGSNPYIP